MSRAVSEEDTKTHKRFACGTFAEHCCLDCMSRISSYQKFNVRSSLPQNATWPMSVRANNPSYTRPAA